MDVIVYLLFYYPPGTKTHWTTITQAVTLFSHSAIAPTLTPNKLNQPVLLIYIVHFNLTVTILLNNTLSLHWTDLHYIFNLKPQSILHYSHSLFNCILHLACACWGVHDHGNLDSRLVHNSEFLNWPPFNSWIGIWNELAPPHRKLNFNFNWNDRMWNSIHGNSKQFQSHKRKNVLNLSYIQFWEGYFGNVIDYCFQI